MRHVWNIIQSLSLIILDCELWLRECYERQERGLSVTQIWRSLHWVVWPGSCLVHTDEKADKCPALSSLDYHLIHQSSRILYSFYHFKWNVLRTSLKISSPFSRWCSGSTSSWWNSSHILQEANYKTRGQWQHSGVPLCHCGGSPAPDHVVPQRCQGARHWQVPGKTILLLYHQLEGGNLWSF